MAEDCPDPIKNLEEAIDSIEEAYLTSQKDAMEGIGKNLDDSVDNLPAGAPPAEQLNELCVALGKTLDGFNSLRASCSFDPTGCLKQVVDSGVLGGNPVAAGAALAAATFVDAASGNYTNPFTIPPPSLGIGVETIQLPGGGVQIPDIPAPPPSEDCRDPISDLNEALQSAEETYLDLHKTASKKLSESINKFTGGLGGLPTSIQSNAFCVGANAGFDAAAALNTTCKIDVGQCIKQVLESGILETNPALAGATGAAALFSDSISGALPSIG